MLAFGSLVNHIHQLTAPVAQTDLSPWGMVGISWPIFIGTSWHFYFQWTFFQESIQYFIATLDYISYILPHTIAIFLERELTVTDIFIFVSPPSKT